MGQSAQYGKAKITDWRIVALSGGTVDGRTVDSRTLYEMAEQYDPALYTARINLEHFRMWLPDAEINGFGDVVALKAEEQPDGKVALLAKMKVNDNLQKLWDTDQKVFSSIEITDDFPGTGKAYLTGVAVTDSPASLGTTRHFSLAAKNAAANNSSISEYVEMNKTAQTPAAKTENHAAGNPAPAADSGTVQVDKNIFSNLLAKVFGKETAQTEPEKLAETPAEGGNNFSLQNLSAQISGMQTTLADSVAAFTALAERVQKQEQQFADLKTQLETEPAEGNRSLHTGGGDEITTPY